MTNLKERWSMLCKRFKIKENQQEFAFKELQSYYQESHRFYHNITHLKALFYLFDLHFEQLENPDLVAFSIWYHDIIYEVPGNQNEEKSANLASLRLRDFGLSEVAISLVQEMILASKKHQKMRKEPSDIDWFLDFDLAILGSDWGTYQGYALAIRKEYGIFPDSIFIPGRIQALSQFLERENIYQTTHFSTHFEALARHNIKQEIERLKKGDFYHHN